VEYTWQQQRKQRQRSRKQKSQPRRRQERRNNLHITLRHFFAIFYESFRTNASCDFIFKDRTRAEFWIFCSLSFVFQTNPGRGQTGVKTAYPDMWFLDILRSGRTVFTETTCQPNHRFW
jgi:hypothetical protein